MLIDPGVKRVEKKVLMKQQKDTIEVVTHTETIPSVRSYRDESPRIQTLEEEGQKITNRHSVQDLFKERPDSSGILHSSVFDYQVPMIAAFVSNPVDKSQSSCVFNFS